MGGALILITASALAAEGGSPVEFVTQARANTAPAPATNDVDTLLPAPEELLEVPAERGSLATRSGPVGVSPLPTPVPVDPGATPLPGPTAAPVPAAPVAPATAPAAPAPPAPGTAPVAPAPPAPAVATLGFPVPGGSISQPFRPGHEGVDIAATPGVPVVAAESGFVVSAGWRNNGGGLVVEIQHAGGLNTVYNHLGSIAVVSGQTVGRGEVIGGMGCSGICNGPHIQFDVRVNGRLINGLELM